MKRKFLVLLCTISVIFSGCSIVEEYGRGTLENKEIKKADEMSPILDDENDVTDGEANDESNVDTNVDSNSDSKETAKADVETPKKDETTTNESKEDKKSEVQTKKETEEKKSEDSKKDEKSDVEDKKTDDKKTDKKSDEKKNENKDTNKAADKNEDKKDETVDLVSSKKDDTPAEPVKNEEPVKKESGDYASLSNEKAGWWFNPKKAGGNGKSTIPEKTSNLLNKYNGIWQAKTDEKVLYLTFDEGYEYNNTAKILDTLKAKGVKAAFFVTGAYIKSNLDLVNRMANEGHLVCNHSVNHLNQVDAIKNPKKLEDDITGLQTLYKEKTGNNLASFMRPPEGVYSERTLKFINDMGYRPVFWSFAYKDWLRDNQPDKKFAIEKITGQFHPGSVLLLHAVSNTNAEILGEIIDKAVNMGYRFGSLYEL